MINAAINAWVSQDEGISLDAWQESLSDRIKTVSLAHLTPMIAQKGLR